MLVTKWMRSPSCSFLDIWAHGRGVGPTFASTGVSLALSEFDCLGSAWVLGRASDRVRKYEKEESL